MRLEFPRPLLPSRQHCGREPAPPPLQLERSKYLPFWLKSLPVATSETNSPAENRPSPQQPPPPRPPSALTSLQRPLATHDEFPKTSLSSLRLQGRRADGKVKVARTVPDRGSEQTGGSLVPRPSWGRGGGGVPQVVHPYRSHWDAPGNEIETSQPPEEMRGGAACPGRVTATGGREDAGAGRAPRVARALLRTDSGGATAPQAVPGQRPKLDRRMAEARDLPAALTRLPATSTPYPGGSREVKGARRPG